MPDFPAAPIVLPVVMTLALLAGCSRSGPPAEDVRPVRALTLATGTVGSSAEFSGDVRPRYESRLGFRVGGKISARKVDVGTVVKRGQVLMQLDPQDLRLGQAQAQANLRAAQTNYELARADMKRYQDLRSQNFVSQAVLDQKVAAARSAQASMEAARAASSEQANQTGYASLESDTDGVVTGIDAEVGQVVQAGTPVVRVAGSATGATSRILPGMPRSGSAHSRTFTSVTLRNSSTWSSGTPITTSFSSVRATRTTGVPACTTCPTSASMPVTTPSVSDSRLA